ncbi:MAG: flippase, partial [Anaerolineales bacterium]
MTSPNIELEKNLDHTSLGVIARGSILILVGSFISILANFVYQFFLARLLGPAEVGIVNLGISIITLVGLVMIFGLDRAVVRYVAHYMGLADPQREMGAILSAFHILAITTLIVTPLFLISSDLLANRVFQKPDLLIVLQILGAGLPFVALTRVLLGISQAYKHMVPILAIEQIAVPVCRVIGFAFLVMVLGVSSSTAALSYTLAAVLGFVPAVVIAGGIYYRRRKAHLPKSLVKEMLQFAWLAMLSIILNRTNTQTETLILGIFSSSVQVGLYTVSLRATIFISIFLDAISMVFTPFIAELYAKKDLARLAEQFKTVTRWAFTLALPVSIFLFLESDDLMMLLGPDFNSGSLVVRILAIAQIAYVILGPGGLMLVMTDYNKLNLINAVLNLILSLLLDLALIPQYGAIGAAIAGAITIVFVNLLRLIQIHRVLKIHPYQWSYIKPIIAGTMSALA